ncbi:hypothetical protein NDU88_005238 [Pleurodeles waltl]|uniref:Uncharacterized protein n=1 Tax=Pleurodeles waltl TaxID=8319 RepID=A0AAV7LKY1_PLEWA|nr:hypothetical protein NDU88_005238 [Pleurodeles waltl]
MACSLPASWIFWSPFGPIMRPSIPSTVCIRIDDIAFFLSRNAIPPISADQRLALEVNIILEEILEAIDDLPFGKALGLDGYLYEYFKINKDM